MNCPVGGEPLHPEGGSGRRLISIIGRDAYDKFERRNACPDKVWSPERVDWVQIKLDMTHRFVAVLGGETWSALQLPAGAGWFNFYDDDHTVWLKVPHPSGRSLHYNLTGNRRKLRKFLRAMAGCR
jgi:hypothetical protein